MSDQRNEATYRAITGGRSPHTERRADWQDGLRLVVGLAGGNVSAAARALDVPRRTLRRWLDPNDKSMPPPERRERVARAARGMVRRDERRRRLKPGREARLRRARKITITSRYRYDVEDRDARVVTFDLDDTGSTGLADGVMGSLIDAYLAGAVAVDGSGLVAVDYTGGLFHRIADAMTDDWYREHMSSHDPDDGFDILGVSIK